MTQINTSDLILATLSNRRGIIVTARMRGVNNIGQVMARMRNLAPDTTGMTTLDVRNPSQGWASSHNIYMR